MLHIITKIMMMIIITAIIFIITITIIPASTRSKKKL